MSRAGLTAAVRVFCAGTLMVAGCSQNTDGPDLRSLVGQTCTVQFKRNSLGAAANLPVNPITTSVNGAEVCLIGKLKDVGSEWLVMETARGEAWIAKTEILLIQPQKK